MSVHDDLKQVMSILESQRQVLAEPAVRKAVPPLEKALQKFLEAAQPYAGIDWDEYMQLTNALNTARITQANLEDVNRRIKSSGLKFQAASKAAKQKLAIQAAQKNEAGNIARELSKSPETLKKEKIYELARANDLADAVRNLPDKAFKDILKSSGIKERKKQRGKKKVLDRDASELSLIEHLKEVRFRIGS